MKGLKRLGLGAAVLMCACSDNGKASDGGLADAPGDVSDETGSGGDGGADACGEVLTDTHNCGTCGRDCLGGACNQGKCGALAISDTEPYVQWIAADSTGAYWTNFGSQSLQYVDGAVRHVDAQSNVTTVFATNKCPYAVAADGVNVYFSLMGTLGKSDAGTQVGGFAGDGTVDKCPAASVCPSPTVLGPTGSGYTPVALNATSIFWWNVTTVNMYMTGPVMTAPKTGGPATPLNNSGTIVGGALLADDVRLYLLNYAAFMQYVLPWGGITTIENLTPNGGSLALDANSTAAYFTVSSPNVNGGSQLRRCPLPGCPGGSVPLVTHVDNKLSGVAVRGTMVYWGDGGAVYACEATSCSSTTSTIAPSPSADAVMQGLAVHQGVLYWAWNTKGATVGHVARIVL